MPPLYTWALERSRLGVDDLARRFLKLNEWMAGDRTPTLKTTEE